MLLQMYSEADVEALSTAEYPAVKEPCSFPALSKIVYMSKTFAASKTFAGAQQARRPVPPSKRRRRSGSARRRLVCAGAAQRMRGWTGEVGGLGGKEWGFLMRKAKPLPCLVTNESS